jgi:hypothetical protein
MMLKEFEQLLAKDPSRVGLEKWDCETYHVWYVNLLLLLFGLVSDNYSDALHILSTSQLKPFF